jgi:murein DD-endopeptidase MepM/ murein hydrolase activator NlpD
MGSLFSSPTPPDAKLPKLTGPGEIITARERQQMAELRKRGRRATILTAGLAPGAEGGPPETPAAPPEPAEPEEVRLSAPIGSVLTNDPRDLLSVARALDAVDPLYPLNPGIASEPPPFLTKELEDRIRKFQRANGLSADGALFSGDETELALNMALAEKRRLQGPASPNPPPPGAGVAQQAPQTPAQRPAGKTPAAGSAQQTVGQPAQQPSAPPSKIVIPKGGKIRNDSQGLGHFGAPRGNRTHAGVDITVTPGQPVPSPIDGIIVRKGDVYTKDNKGLRSTHIEGTGKYAGYKAIIFYVDNGQLPMNGQVKAGDPLGPAQDVRVKHGNSMQTHVHYQLYKNGKLIDPTGMLP